MLHDISLTVAQLAAITTWHEPSGASVLIAWDIDTNGILVGQGDARCHVAPDGTITEEN